MPVSSSSVMNMHALGAAGPLTHQHQAGGLQPSPIARLHGLGAGDDPARRKIGAQEGDGCWRKVSPTWR